MLLKFIVKDGVTSRNTPASSKKALELTIHTLHVDGVETNVYLTKDDCLIIYPEERIYGIPIIEQNFTDLRGYNLGSRVKHHFLIPLQEALDVFKNSKKEFVLQLSDHGNKNRQYVEKIIFLISQYPKINIYLKSDSEEIITLLSNSKIQHQVGAIIDSFDSKLCHFPLDFYSLNIENMDTNQALEQLANGKVLMTEQVNTVEQVRQLEQCFHDYLEQLHCVSSFPLKQ